MPGEGSDTPDGGGQESRNRSLPALSGKRAVFGLGIIALVVVVLLSGNPLAAVSRIALPVLVAAVIAVAAIGAGTAGGGLLERILGSDGSSGSGDLATRLIVGYPLFGGVAFLFALVSTSLVVLLVPVVASFAIGLRSLWRRKLFTDDASFGIGAVILAALLLTGVMMALLPAVSLDEVSYHLAIPRVWLAEGSAVSLPLMSHSWFPLGTESADLPALAALGARGAIASHLLHLFVAIAGAIVLLRALPRSRLSTIGLGAMLSTPAIILGAGWSGTDVPLVAVSFVLFLSLDRFLRGSEGVNWIAASIAAGLLIKYTFLPVVVLLVGAALIYAGPRRKALIVASVCGALAGSLFFVRNLILTGNPIEPFLSATGGEIARFRWSGSWGETLSSYMFDTRMIDDSLGFVLPALALASLALVRGIDVPWRRIAALAMLVMAAILTIIGPAGRILLPFLIIPAWIALATLIRRKHGTSELVAGSVLILATLIQIAVSWLHLDRLDPLKVVTATIEDRQWVSAHRHSMELIRQGNQLVPADRRTLVVGVNELFWFDRRVVGGANFDSPRVSTYLSAMPDVLARRWEQDGITHVLMYPRLIGVGPPEAQPRERQRTLLLTPQAATALAETLRRYGEVERQSADAVLYRVSDLTEPDP